MLCQTDGDTLFVLANHETNFMQQISKPSTLKKKMSSCEFSDVHESCIVKSIYLKKNIHTHMVSFEIK